MAKSEQYNEFRELINNKFSGDRLKSLNKMYDWYDKNDRMDAPASGVAYYHNCFDGGYIDHILRVHDNIHKMKKFYAVTGGMIDFTDEQASFVSIHHDLGKLGSVEHPYYTKESDPYKIKNYSYYRKQEFDQYSSVNDLTLFMLQHFGVKYDRKEMISISLTDGLYIDDNKKYFIAHSIQHQMNTNLPYLSHWADHMATLVEKDAWYSVNKMGRFREE